MAKLEEVMLDDENDKVSWKLNQSGKNVTESATESSDLLMDGLA